MGQSTIEADERTDRQILLSIELRLERLECGRDQDRGVSRADRGVLERLLPALAGALGSELFLSADVVEHESPALRFVCQGMSARRLGRLLKRAAGAPVNGYIVERAAVEAGAVLWRILQVPAPPALSHTGNG